MGTVQTAPASLDICLITPHLKPVGEGLLDCLDF
jgi:hypothetical protein